MIVDGHVHSHWQDPDERPGEIMDLMRHVAERNGIEKQIIAGSGGFSSGVWDEKVVGDSNTTTLMAMAEYPESWMGCCLLNPKNDPSFTREESERCIVEGGMVGIKLHVHANAREKCLDPVMERALELGVPVVYHAWYKTTDRKSNESDPTDIADLARRHPKVPIVMAHLTGCGARGVQDIKGCSNVLMDTSGGQPEAVTLEYAVREIGVERVVYGSDFPGRDYATQLARVHGADLTQPQKDAILGGNAIRLYKIPC